MSLGKVCILCRKTSQWSHETSCKDSHLLKPTEILSNMSTQPPVASANKSQPELTIRVILLGLFLSVIMGAANVYVGLKAGMTVSASIPAAVLAMLVFRMFRKSSILEANQVQTCASAGESLAAGIIFTMPALLLIGYWEDFDFWTVSMIALTGGLLGILFMIPMRKVFVVGNDDLPFPEGLACAEVLKTGEGGEAHRGAAVGLILGGVLGAFSKVTQGFLGLIGDKLETAHAFGNRIFYFGGDVSPMLVAVGFIVRLNVAILIFIGGAMAWLIGIPLIGAETPITDPIDQAGSIWSSQIRYVGVGAMVMGGIASLFSVRKGLWTAISELSKGLSGKQEAQSEDQKDLNPYLINGIGLACLGVLAGLNYYFTRDIGITAVCTLVMGALAFFFTAVASYIVGLVGNSNSPVSGMTITAVLAAGAVLWLFNMSGEKAMVATLGIAAVVCCVACTAGDVCNDLKTGSLVGATPFRQQIMQILGVGIAAFVMAPTLTILHTTTEGGIGGEKLSAPQANLFASLAKGFSGEAELPWNLIGVGAVLGLAILIIDSILKAQGSKMRAHLMPIAVGMYLPFGLSVPILIGGLLAYFHSRKATPEEAHRRLHRGVLFSSGVIAGESLTAVGIAIFATVFGVSQLKLGLPAMLVTGATIIAAILMVVIFYVMSIPSRESEDT